MSTERKLIAGKTECSANSYLMSSFSLLIIMNVIKECVVRVSLMFAAVIQLPNYETGDQEALPLW